MKNLLVFLVAFPIGCASVSQEKMSELKVGMSKEDVVDILDTPNRATILDEGVEYLEYNLDSGKGHGACILLTVAISLGLLTPVCYMNDTEENVVVLRDGAVSQYGAKVNFTKEYVQKKEYKYDINLNQNIRTGNL